MRRIDVFVCLAVVSLGGCPSGGVGDPAIQPVIGVSASRGQAPLPVVLSALDSLSARPIERYVWDLGGEEIVEGATVAHTFVRPGRYDITLTITDDSGASASTQTTVRVEGGAVLAAIDADRTSGIAPLLVRFEGGNSTAADDTIRDYFWDFGDGETSRQRAPLHVYERAGTFTPRLRVVSEGGIEGIATTTIEVGAPDPGSLEFDGAQVVTLPFASLQVLDDWTFEARVRIDSAGGTLLNLGAPNVTVELDAAAGMIRISTIAGAEEIVTTFDMTAGWFHFAVTHDAADGFVAYLNGDASGAAVLDGGTTADALTVGSTLQGNLIEVRFWLVARTPAQVQQGSSGDVDPSASGLIGAWGLQDGAGQTLANAVAGGLPGVRGATAAVENGDPVWSTEAP